MNSGSRLCGGRGPAHASALLLTVMVMTPLHSAIIYTDLPDVNLMAGGFGGEAAYDVDFDGDVTPELNIYSRGEFSTITAHSTRVAGIGNTPPDLSGFAHPFVYGDAIGPIPPEFRSWFTGYGNLLACQDLGCKGLWHDGGTNYLGVEFQMQTGTHYGWVAIEMPFSDFPGGYVLSYAYESQPGTPILAGAIPEPSTGMLVAAGTFLALQRSGNARKENKTLQLTPRGWLVSKLHLVLKILGIGKDHSRP